MARGEFALQAYLNRWVAGGVDEPPAHTHVELRLDGRGNQVLIKQLSAQHHFNISNTHSFFNVSNGPFGGAALYKIVRERVGSQIIDTEWEQLAWAPSYVTSPVFRDITRIHLFATAGTFRAGSLHSGLIRLLSVQGFFDEF